MKKKEIEWERVSWRERKRENERKREMGRGVVGSGHVTGRRGAKRRTRRRPPPGASPAAPCLSLPVSIFLLSVSVLLLLHLYPRPLWPLTLSPSILLNPSALPLSFPHKTSLRSLPWCRTTLNNFRRISTLHLKNGIMHFIYIRRHSNNSADALTSWICKILIDIREKHWMYWCIKIQVLIQS